MSKPTKLQGLDRRMTPRFAATGAVSASLLDDNAQSVVLLRDVQVTNISAGGIALSTSTKVPPSSMVRAYLGDVDPYSLEPRSVTLEVLECRRCHSKFEVRCRLLEGRIPAQLLLDWFAGSRGPVPA